MPIPTGDMENPPNSNDITDLSLKGILATDLIDPNFNSVWEFREVPEGSDHWQLHTDLTLTAGVSSFGFGRSHIMSSTGEDVIFKNLRSGVNWSPGAWQGVVMPTIVEEEGVISFSGEEFIKPSTRVYENIKHTVLGVPSTTGSILTEDVHRTATDNTAYFGIAMCVAEELIDDFITYEVWDSDSNMVIFEENMMATLAIDDYLVFNFSKPNTMHQGTNYTRKMFKRDGSPLLVRTSSIVPTVAWFNLVTSTYKQVESATSEDLGNVFITNITSAGNTLITRKAEPNEEVVESVQMANLTATVTVEWDRNNSYEGTPTINGVAVTRTGKVGGNTYTGTANISGSYSEIVADLNGSQHIVPLDALARPVIEAVQFHSGYPVNQTEVKAGDTFGISITCDTPYVAVETQEYEACAYASYTASGSIDAIIGNRGDVATQRVARVRVKNATGTWSLWSDTSNTILCNNLHPTITLDSKTYPNGQEALKDSEEVLINYSTINANTVTKSATSNLTITSNGATRASGDYENATYTITAKRSANGATVTYDVPVRIAHVDVVLANNTPVQVRSGIGAVTLGCTFNQDLLIALSNPTITAVDGDAHSLTTLYETITVTNLAGKQVNLNRAYFIKGFAQKTLVVNYPEELIDIGTSIVTANDVTVTGVINSTPPYDICTNRVTSGNIVLVGDYVLNTTTVEIDKQLCAEFNYDNFNNITIYIEEV